MLHFPHHREIAALFVKPRTVAGTTKMLSDTTKRLDDVAQHHMAKGDEKSCLAGELRYEARRLDDEVIAHQREVGRAAAITTKIEALLS
jgi:hypothetical protein